MVDDDAVSRCNTNSSLGRADEQDRWLLREWKRRADDRHGVASKRWSIARMAIFCGAVLAFLSALVVVGSAMLGFGTQAPQEMALPGRIRNNNYILDPEWDVDAAPQRREYTFTITDRDYNPDGVFRPMMLVNDEYPGPLIEVNEGDTIVLHVNNQAINATSIHLHGLYQNSTPYFDGTVGVTQCPIAPGRSFTYESTVTGQSGTYWWHAHQGLQSSDGVHGPLIIHSRREKSLQRMPYDTDRVILISDHYHDLSSALLWQYLKPDAENAEPVPVSGLINGRSIRNCEDFPERRCDNTTSGVGIPRFGLDSGKSHRLRLINVGAFAEFQFQVDEHELAVTEVDGTDVEPASFHRINVNPAQRYSVVLRADVADRSSFWLRARMITSCFTDPSRHMKPDVLAVVQYDDTSEQQPTTRDWEEQLGQQCNDMNTSELIPVERFPAPQDADAFFYLRSNFEIGRWRLSRGFFNGSSFRPNPSSPVLHRAVDGLAAANSSFQSADNGVKAFVNGAAFDGSRELVIQTTGVQTIDFLISNFDDGNHPLHLHGYKYWVLAQGHGYPPLTHVGADINRENLTPLYDSLDLSNPLRRDTASVEAFGWILIRLVADNPGSWLYHCHISWHSEAGLAMQLLTRADELADMQIPAANLELCAAKDITKGMGPDDEEYRELAK
ncbi:hypothetical protein DOTSEDRAFT_68090 [Dothistroma septosporum NZE10]|uniref:Multicopper oxidase-like protein n=1 Tax=Dothistroma septosporum (strain NZE10 / CBS 128990) TaxID=675120 RepID=N1Q0C0_DOTSN|nr:hypothetical protein DOTSEDRAFT_68090 [Dothistroma septosporum NZE10]